MGRAYRRSWKRFDVGDLVSAFDDAEPQHDFFIGDFIIGTYEKCRKNDDDEYGDEQDHDVLDA